MVKSALGDKPAPCVGGVFGIRWLRSTVLPNLCLFGYVIAPLFADPPKTFLFGLNFFFGVTRCWAPPLFAHPKGYWSFPLSCSHIDTGLCFAAPTRNRIPCRRTAPKMARIFRCSWAWWKSAEVIHQRGRSRPTRTNLATIQNGFYSVRLVSVLGYSKSSSPRNSNSLPIWR